MRCLGLRVEGGRGIHDFRLRERVRLGGTKRDSIGRDRFCFQRAGSVAQQLLRGALCSRKLLGKVTGQRWLRVTSAKSAVSKSAVCVGWRGDLRQIPKVRDDCRHQNHSPRIRPSFVVCVQGWPDSQGRGRSYRFSWTLLLCARKQGLGLGLRGETTIQDVAVNG